MRTETEALLQSFAEAWVSVLSRKYPKHPPNITRDDWDVLTAFAERLLAQYNLVAKGLS